MNDQDAFEARGKEYEQFTKNLTVGVEAMETIPGTGMVVNSFLRGLIPSANATVGKAGVLVKDADAVVKGFNVGADIDPDAGFTRDITITAMDELGDYMLSLSQDVAQSISSYNKLRPEGFSPLGY